MRGDFHDDFSDSGGFFSGFDTFHDNQILYSLIWEKVAKSIKRDQYLVNQFVDFFLQVVPYLPYELKGGVYVFPFLLAMTPEDGLSNIRLYIEGHLNIMPDAIRDLGWNLAVLVIWTYEHFRVLHFDFTNHEVTFYDSLVRAQPMIAQGKLKSDTESKEKRKQRRF